MEKHQTRDQICELISDSIRNYIKCKNISAAMQLVTDDFPAISADQIQQYSSYISQVSEQNRVGGNVFTCFKSN